MTRQTWWMVGGGLASVALFALGAAFVQAQQPPAPPLADRGKKKIEVSTEGILADAKIQVPGNEGDNPKVTPGKVKWHADLATACVAAKRSGKPVLLFQMMGKLDDKFC